MPILQKIVMPKVRTGEDSRTCEDIEIEIQNRQILFLLEFNYKGLVDKVRTLNNQKIYFFALGLPTVHFQLLRE